MLIYMIGNGVLIVAYYIVYIIYFKKKSAELALALAVIPSCVFLLSGILLRHWLLVGFAAVFAIAHIYVTKKNNKKRS